MANKLKESLNTLKDNVMQLARELHANKTLESRLAAINQNNISDMIYVQVQFIAALNGDICNGKKASHKQSLKNLLAELASLNIAVQSDATLSKQDKEKLSEFLNGNIMSIGNILDRTFSR